LVDPDGQIVDIVLDLGFIAFDLFKLVSDNLINGCDNLGTNLAALGGDVLGALTPGLTGVGLGIRASSKVTQVGKLSKLPPITKKIGFGKKAADPNKKIIDQLQGKGQLKNLRKNRNLKNVNIEELLQKKPAELRELVKQGEISKITLRQIMKAFEGRHLGQ